MYAVFPSTITSPWRWRQQGALTHWYPTQHHNLEDHAMDFIEKVMWRDSSVVRVLFTTSSFQKSVLSSRPCTETFLAIYEKLSAISVLIWRNLQTSCSTMTMHWLINLSWYRSTRQIMGSLLFATSLLFGYSPCSLLPVYKIGRDTNSCQKKRWKKLWQWYLRRLHRERPVHMLPVVVWSLESGECLQKGTISRLVCCKICHSDR